MIVRLLLALLLASFTVPAAAAAPACHDDTAMGMTHHQAPEKQGGAHVCVGCVPLADWLGTRIVPRIPPRARQPHTTVVRLDLGGATAPALPPPRAS